MFAVAKPTALESSPTDRELGNDREFAACVVAKMVFCSGVMAQNNKIEPIFTAKTANCLARSAHLPSHEI